MSKPENHKQIARNVKLACYPLHLEELEAALSVKNCDADLWAPAGELTPLHRIVRYASTSGGSMDDEDATAAATLLLNAKANPLHSVNVFRGTNTVSYTHLTLPTILRV